MSPTSPLTTSIVACLLFASPAFAQTAVAPQHAAAPAPAADTGNNQVSDMTNVPLSSPAAADPNEPQAQPAPTPAPAPQPAPGAAATGAAPTAAAAAPPPPPPPAAQPVNTWPEPQPSEAPDRVHQGFYMRIVNAPAFVSMRGTGPAGDAKLTGLGSASVISLGGSIAPGLVLGGTIQSLQLTAKFNGGPFIGSRVTNANGDAFDASNKASVATSGLGLLLDWFPNPSGGWHAGMTAGVGVLALQNLADSSSMVGTHLNGSLFGGYDWSIGKAWSLGLELSLSATTSNTLKDANDTNIDTGYRLKSIAVGLGASILYF